MTTQADIPAKWYVPFANGDGARVEIPVTTPDPTRASQTLGFPPLTMQPPEAGGVPPQGEDFNGAMNQVARVAWWVLNGGGWPYDAAFATNASIGGYPNGATLQSADLRGDWISTGDSNTVNPDTTAGNWVPGFQYGMTALTGLTGGTITPTPAQAAKRAITLAGTLTSALTINLPTWLKDWDITNNTTGAFVTIVKTAAGSGVTIPQNGAPTRVTGDGTNITQSPANIVPAVSATQVAQLAQIGQTPGGLGALSATVAANALTVTLTAALTAFRSSTLNSGAVNTVLPATNPTITVPSGATLGTTNGAPATLAVLLAYNGGTPVLCIANAQGVGSLSETTLISPTTISAGATSASVIYSASAVGASSPYRFVGYLTITEATAGTWATAPTLVQASGGQAGPLLPTFGADQIMTSVIGSRALNTTYTNTTGKPISVEVWVSLASGATLTVVKGGVSAQTYGNANAGSVSFSVFSIVLPNQTYQISATLATTLTAWNEIR